VDQAGKALSTGTKRHWAILGPACMASLHYLESLNEHPLATNAFGYDMFLEMMPIVCAVFSLGPQIYCCLFLLSLFLPRAQGGNAKMHSRTPSSSQANALKSKSMFKCKLFHVILFCITLLEGNGPKHT